MRSDYQDAVKNDFYVQNTQGVKINVEDPKERLREDYTRKDKNWKTGSHQGDIYISTPDNTHNEILKYFENPDYKIPEKGYPGTSGFFTNEGTASKHFTDDGKFDSVGLGRELQQAPYFDKKKADYAELLGQNYYPEYNGNLDYFKVNPEKMQEHFGTTDFYAAMSKCTENTAWGEGGGFQGYNPYINEMINKGCLEYVPEKSRICENNKCLDYSKHKAQASEEAKAVSDYVDNNKIVARDGERLGYNEISNNINVSANNTEPPDIISSKNIASVGGGGANAPNDRDLDLNKDLGLQGTATSAVESTSSVSTAVSGGIT